MKDYVFYGSLAGMIVFAIIARFEDFARGPLVVTGVCAVVAIGLAVYSDWQRLAAYMRNLI